MGGWMGACGCLREGGTILCRFPWVGRACWPVLIFDMTMRVYANSSVIILMFGLVDSH